MYIARGLFILSFGSLLRFISCYSDGGSLGDQCQGMNILHTDGGDVQIPEQGTEAPFKVEPENVTLTDSELNATITVTLSGVSRQFEGFMLDSRQCDTCESVGTFSLENTATSLLICGGSVVVHPNNRPKGPIRVFWTSKDAGLFFFRVAVVEDYFTFWRRKPIVIPSTTQQPSETSAHITTSPAIFPTDSNATAFTTGTSTAPPISETTTPSTVPSQCVQYMRCVLALLLFSRLCFLGGSSLLIIIRPVLKKTATMSASVLELASKTIAAILVLIKAIKYECVCECAGFRIVFTALTVAAMVSSLLHSITVLLHCGPSHELRKCWLCAIVIFDLMNTAITTTAIFFVTRCFEESWLAILMGVYVAWEIIWYLGSVCYALVEKYQTREKVRKNQNHILEKKISPWLIMFIIFTIFYVMLTVALMTGVSLVRTIN